jgi:hypothetical protein
MSQSGSPFQQGPNPFGEKPVNPYAAPQYAEGMSGAVGGRTAAQIKLIKDFRSQSLALGVAWCIFALLCLIGLAALVAFSGLAAGDERMQAVPVGLLMGILGVCGVIWLVSGIFTLMKQTWGIWLGTIASGLSAVGNLLNFNLCGLAIAGILLWQGIRVIGFMNEMTRLGIPLDEKA